MADKECQCPIFAFALSAHVHNFILLKINVTQPQPKNRIKMNHLQNNRCLNNSHRKNLHINPKHYFERGAMVH